jgi:hypothetical protein
MNDSKASFAPHRKIPSKTKQYVALNYFVTLECKICRQRPDRLGAGKQARRTRPFFAPAPRHGDARRDRHGAAPSFSTRRADDC